MQEEKDKGKTTYNHYGFHSAKKSESDPEGIYGYLDNIYDQFLEEQRIDEKGLKDRISKLKAETLLEKNKKNNLNADISSSKRHKEEKEKDIEELELEKIEIRNGDGELGDNSSFVIGAFITLLLTMYLFVFYSSSGYSTFYGIKPGTLGFINPNVFSDASKSGGGVVALVLLFPVIFLGLGFLIHNSIENNKKLVLKGLPKSYVLISALLTITLIADVFIGYKISQNIHTNEFNVGLTTDTWKFKMIFEDVNFYLVLILGFVVYVIWGLLLNYVLSHSYLKTENEKIKLQIENINNKIIERRNELTEIISKTHKLESDTITCDSIIQEKEKNIIGYENGVIPVNMASLKALIGEFMGGWQSYTYGNFFTDEAQKLNNEALKSQTKWINEKIQNLNSENK